MSSLALVGLYEEIIVVQGLPLNVDHIFSVAFFQCSSSLRSIKARRLRSISIFSMVAFTEFFDTDTEINDQP